MTSAVTITLELDVVQRAIHAKVAPVVEKILASAGIERRIEVALLECSKRAGDDAWHHGMLLRASMFGHDDGLPVIDKLLARAIKEAAFEFVKKSVHRERANIEEAFKRMLAASGDMIARTMFDALEGGITNEWRFNLDTKMIAERKSAGDD